MNHWILQSRYNWDNVDQHNMIENGNLKNTFEIFIFHYLLFNLFCSRALVSTNIKIKYLSINTNKNSN